MDARYLGVAVSTYDSPHYAALARADTDARSLGGYLAARGFSARYLDSPTKAEVDRQFRASLAGAANVIVYWTGHGVTPNQQDLRLVTRDTTEVAGRIETCQPSVLVEAALQAGASQVLIILDTCYSGAAAVAAIEAVAQFDDAQPTVDGGRWVGIAMSCQSYDKAVAGRFAEALGKLLRDGPSTEAFRIHWSAHNEGVRGSDVLDALKEEWPHDTQVPSNATFGSARPMLPNPRYDPHAPEHLVLAARGIAQGEDGWYFTGRRRALGAIVDWLHGGTTGLYVVTGPAGSGKSAVVGRIAALSDPDERARLAANAEPAPDEPDPGPGAVDVVLSARGQSYDTLLAELSRRLGAIGAVSVYGVLDQLIRQRRVPTIVIDALDEAQSGDLTHLVSDLLVPLSVRARILVGTRALPIAENRTLVDLLGASATVLDLAGEADTTEDIRRYAIRRLGDTANADVDEIAAAVAERAKGSFLYARMVTSRLRLEPLSTTVAGWTEALDESVVSALGQDLARLNDERRSAARHLLTALAFSYGKGLPVRDVWAELASALADGVSYEDSDVAWVLDDLGGYIVEGGEFGQAVYRLFHQELVDRLCRDKREGLRVDRRMKDFVTLGLANPYLDNYGRAHRTRAAGLEVDVVRADGDGARLAAALGEYSRVLAEDGRRDEALAPATEAVDLYRGRVDRRAEFATALNNLATRYADVGRYEDSLDTAEEATEEYRTLAYLDPGEYVPTLAGALNNLATRMAALGRRDGALAFAEEAVGGYRMLALTEPDVYLAPLALTLNNLANRFAGLGHREDALDAAREAVAVRRALVEVDPAHLPSLALSVNNLAKRLADLGRREDALAAAQEAVSMRRDLARTRSAAHLPSLALSLNNLADRYADLLQLDRALVAAEDAVTVQRGLVESNPAAYLPDLASSLTALSRRLADLGRHADALPPARDAAAIYRDLAATNPAHVPNHAGSLVNLANRLGAVGEHGVSLDTAQEAVSLYRPLAAANPAAYSPALGSALSGLSDRLGAAGRRDEAVAIADEALGVYVPLVQANPGAYVGTLAVVMQRMSKVEAREAILPRVAVLSARVRAYLERAI